MARAVGSELERQGHGPEAISVVPVKKKSSSDSEGLGETPSCRGDGANYQPEHGDDGPATEASSLAEP